MLYLLRLRRCRLLLLLLLLRFCHVVTSLIRKAPFAVRNRAFRSRSSPSGMSSGMHGLLAPGRVSVPITGRITRFYAITYVERCHEPIIP